VTRANGVRRVSAEQTVKPKQHVASDPGRRAGERRYWVRSVDRTVRLLYALAEDDGRAKTLGQLADAARMPESSALRYLATLGGLGMIEHEGTGTEGRYRLGLGLFSLAQVAIGNLNVRVVALPFMQQLVDRYGETVNLAVFRHRRLVIIEALEGPRSVRQGARVGERDRLRCTALGKAVLASRPDDEALALLHSEPVERWTERTIVTDEAMLRELHLIREQGYAIDNEESELGLRCVGVAIPHGRGHDFALSISGPSHLFSLDRAREAGPVLVEVARELRRRFQPMAATQDRQMELRVGNQNSSPW
jgi:IclR family KDG regulon transcriptional repressor